MDREELELLGRLQVKAGRTVLRHGLIMAGNALLLGFLFVLVLLSVWFVVWQTNGAMLRSLSCGLLGLDQPSLDKLVAAALVFGKSGAFVVLLAPGLALRLYGQAMKP